MSLKPLGNLFTLLLAAALAAGVAVAQSQAPDSTSSDKKKKQEPKSLSDQLPQREETEKERKRREKQMMKELDSHFRTWLNEDVGYIISDEEKTAFLRLNTDEEREQFVEQFWLRRDPTPDSPENEFKEEHYRRIAYVNERFSSGKPGWRTDRGRIYIAWGPPDEIESYPSGGTYYREMEEGGGSTSVYPFERWRYRWMEGVGEQVILEFVDPTFSGEYRLTFDPTEKDALLYVPNAGPSFLEEMGLASKEQRFDRADGSRLPILPTEIGRQGARMGPGLESSFERMRIYAAVLKPPPVKFPDLEALVTTRISFNLLPFDVRTDFLRITDDTTLVPVTLAVKKKDVALKLQDGLYQSTVNVFGRVTTLTGRVVQTFEDVLRLNIPPALLEQTLEQPSVYQKALPLKAGLYKLNLVLKDLNSGNIGTMEMRLAVPRFEEETLAHSSLILADLIERVPAKNVGSGQFVLGDIKVRPVVDDVFTHDQRMGIYLQVYNLGINEQTQKPDAMVEYTIRKGDQTVFTFQETTADLQRYGQQITLEKVLPLGSFQPGDYTLDIKVTDRVRNLTLAPSAKFHIEK
jgi:GWxTD domain-containing protein